MNLTKVWSNFTVKKSKWVFKFGALFNHTCITGLESQTWKSKWTTASPQVKKGSKTRTCTCQKSKSTNKCDFWSKSKSDFDLPNSWLETHFNFLTCILLFHLWSQNLSSKTVFRKKLQNLLCRILSTWVFPVDSWLLFLSISLSLVSEVWDENNFSFFSKYLISFDSTSLSS